MIDWNSLNVNKLKDNSGSLGLLVLLQPGACGGGSQLSRVTCQLPVTQIPLYVGRTTFLGVRLLITDHTRTHTHQTQSRQSINVFMANVECSLFLSFVLILILRTFWLLHRACLHINHHGLALASTVAPRELPGFQPGMQASPLERGVPSPYA